MTEKLIIGYGNALRGDDGIGIRILKSLERRGVPDGVRLICCQQLTPEIAEDLAHCTEVLFVDASAEGSPGEIREREILPRGTGGSEPTTHAHSPEELLETAYALYGVEPAARVLTVAGERFDYGERLSEVVYEAKNEAVRRILASFASGIAQTG